MLKGGGVLKSSYKRTNFPIPWCVLLKFRTNACLPSSLFNLHNHHKTIVMLNIYHNQSFLNYLIICPASQEIDVLVL